MKTNIHFLFAFDDDDVDVDFKLIVRLVLLYYIVVILIDFTYLFLEKSKNIANLLGRNWNTEIDPKSYLLNDCLLLLAC